jgi:hypothetical protein
MQSGSWNLKSLTSMPSIAQSGNPQSVQTVVSQSNVNVSIYEQLSVKVRSKAFFFFEK